MQLASNLTFSGANRLAYILEHRTPLLPTRSGFEGQAWNAEPGTSMPHTIEIATSGRSKCRGCGQTIGKGELRLGERMPNPFAEGTEMTHWFHPRCAAMKRPEVFLETISGEDSMLEAAKAESLKTIAESGIEHRRLPRIDGVHRSPTGRAACRSCKESIEKDAWRVKLVFHEEGRFNPAGYIHLTCSSEYLGTSDIVVRITQFSPDLSEDELADIERSLNSSLI